ncbi:methyltransferase [Paenibacillus sp. CCS19]|uniref:class I SAM-dependent methyltransferase n=1 Tax=Paenibacillus sp. CCS19 TaxID=3158387 RepID=UPI00255D4292|nr:class I SAM-dependent methyltransferase [Paenibacillus cellulosilyticus]GMK38869.1 methyltransferase [Paenibacillus cellulosilyticus]
MSSYYGELCTKLYEIDKSIAAGKELEFYLSFVDRSNPRFRVLEPMCGNGRMLIPFMQNDIAIDGFDISEDMLQACRAKGERLNLTPQVSLQKIEEFVSPNRYDLIMIPFGSFSLLPDELVGPSLANMKAVLADGGKMLLTTMMKYDGIVEIPDWQESSRKDVDDGCMVTYRKVQYDQERAMLLTQLKYEFVRNDQVIQTERMDFPLRLYEFGEFEGVLEANGFQHVLHDVKDGYGAGTSFHVFECQPVRT